MKISIDKEEARRLAEYHAEDSHGLTPVLDTDGDLVEWVEFTVRYAVGAPSDEPITVKALDGSVTVEAASDIIADMNLTWL